MAKPLVAIVGRPNVGKSTFFNKMAGKRISIVDDMPGVTRDRITADAEWLGHNFTLIDTGGIDPRSDDVLLSQMREQAEIAMDLADVICFFTDARDGLTEDDKDVANMLRKTTKPVLLVVNKVDYLDLNDNLYEFYELGLGDPIGISSVNMLGFGDLLDRMIELFPEDADNTDDEAKPIQLAIVGRPNVGKSSLTNRLLGENRTMVSDIAGTTRDAIDSLYTAEDGTVYNIIDTAGIRRKRSVEDETLERYSVLRSIAAIRRCDVALLLIDANDGVTEQDTKIAGLINDEGKANWEIRDIQPSAHVEVSFDLVGDMADTFDPDDIYFSGLNPVMVMGAEMLPGDWGIKGMEIIESADDYVVDDEEEKEEEEEDLDDE